MEKVLDTKYKQYYWKNPERMRALQRAKYKLYPEKMKERNKKWQEENQEYFKELVKLNSRIHYHRKHGHDDIVIQLEAEKKLLKEAHRSNEMS